MGLPHLDKAVLSRTSVEWESCTTTTPFGNNHRQAVLGVRAALNSLFWGLKQTNRESVAVSLRYEQERQA